MTPITTGQTVTLTDAMDSPARPLGTVKALAEVCGVTLALVTWGDGNEITVPVDRLTVLGEEDGTVPAQHRR